MPPGRGCSLSQISQAISLRRSRLCALKLCGVHTVLLTRAVGCKEQMSQCVSHFDRHVMSADSDTRSDTVMLRRVKEREVCQPGLTETPFAPDIRDRVHSRAKHISCQQQTRSTGAHLNTEMP